MPSSAAGSNRLLSGVDDITVVGTAADGEQAIEVVRRTKPDVVLMDLQMPGVDGVAATRQIVADGGPDVLVLTSFSDAERIVAALDAGAVGYLLKDAEADDVIAGVRAVSRGSPRSTRVPPGSCWERGRRAGRSIVDLTPRELGGARAGAQGPCQQADRAPARISERTVKAHLTSVFSRIGVVDRTQAALWPSAAASATHRSDLRGRRAARHAAPKWGAGRLGVLGSQGTPWTRPGHDIPR